MRKSNELQIGKAGEYIACADIITKGLIAYPSEQGLPYDVVIDTGEKLLKCQVKTTEKPRAIPQRNKDSYAYIFNIKRHGKGGKKRYTGNEVDLFALVELENRAVAYLTPENMPDTINIRVDSMRGSYHDEVGIKNYSKVLALMSDGFTQSQCSRNLGLNVATISRMCKAGYNPHKTEAVYFSDLDKGRGWFCGI